MCLALRVQDERKYRAYFLCWWSLSSSGRRETENTYKIMLEINTVEKRDRWAIVEGHKTFEGFPREPHLS